MSWVKLAGFVFAVLVMELVLSYAVGFIPGSETFKGVILGALIAGTVGIGGELLRGERDSRQDSVKRSNDRKIDSDRFQRENMLQLQNDLAASANMSDVQTRARIIYRAHGVPIQPPMTERTARTASGIHIEGGDSCTPCP